MPPSRSPAAGEVVCDYTLLRELGLRAPPTYAAKGPARAGGGVVVVERLKCDAGVTRSEADAFAREAKRFAMVRHPNVAGARDVSITAEDVIVATDLIEGATYGDLVRAAHDRGETIPLAIELRILIDVLQGLGALHERRDSNGEPAGLIHGCVAPLNVVVGLDGTARVIAVCRVARGVSEPPVDALGYLAPEVLLADANADARADVYGVGAILWEILAGARMHTEITTNAIVLRLLGGKIARPGPHADGGWTEPLIDAAMRAIAPDPSLRFQTAAAMTGELRRVAGTKLASKLVVAQLVETLCGVRIRARRVELGGGSKPAPRPSIMPPAPMSRRDLPTPIVSTTDDAVEIVEIDLAPDPSDAKIARTASLGTPLPSVLSSTPPPLPPRTPLIASSKPPPLPSVPPKTDARPVAPEPSALQTRAPVAPSHPVYPAPIPSHGAMATADRETPAPPVAGARTKKRAIAIGVAIVAIAACVIFAMMPSRNDAAATAPTSATAPLPAETEIPRLASPPSANEARSAAASATGDSPQKNAEITREPSAAPKTDAGLTTDGTPKQGGAPKLEVTPEATPAPEATRAPARAADSPPATKPKKPRYDPMGI